MSSRHSNQSNITPEGVSTFEHVARRLGLSPETYASSQELKEWVRRNKDEKYVPLQLLELWGFDVIVDTLELVKKPPKRAA
jgi:hypothetical protein